MNLHGKIALVTGGAVRIGSAISRALAGKGCDVVIHYHRSKKQAVVLAARLRRLGVRVFTVSNDFQSPDDCRQIVEKSIEIAGGLDILINNAAVFHKDNLTSVSESNIGKDWDVNFMAPLRMIKAFARYARNGKIINLLDSRVTSNETDALTYVLSKKALASLTKIAAVELAPAIAVNGVAPGPVLRSSTQKAVREKAGFMPLKKKPTVNDVVKAVLFLLECDSITGQIIFVDGGQHLLGRRG